MTTQLLVESFEFLRRYLILVLLGLMPGCRFAELRRDLGMLDTAARLPIRLECASFEAGPLVAAVLTPGEMGMSVANYGVARASGRLVLPVAAGRHYLVAFQDLNGNLKFDSGEPAGRFGEPTLLELAAGQTHAEIKLKVTVEGGRPDAWPAGFGEQANNASLPAYLPVIGEVVSLDDARFDPAIGQDGLWSPAAFMRAGGRTGTYFLENFDPEKPIVLMVHGIGGTPRSFVPLLATFQSAGYQSWFFYYASGIRLADAAGVLARSIRTLYATYRPRSPITVIGYSMGGLVCRAALGQLSTGGDAALARRLITISTPFGGVESAELGLRYAPVAIPCWHDIEPGSEFLDALPETRLPAELPHTVFFSTRSDGGVSRRNQDGVVLIASELRPEIQDQAERIIAVDATHIGILLEPRLAVQLKNILERDAGRADSGFVPPSRGE